MALAPGKQAKAKTVLSERQQKWFASIQAGLERDTGKSLDEWVKIAKTCPETAPRKRALWLKEKYGLGQNRAAQVLNAAFPSGPDWSEPDQLLNLLWKEKEGRAIYEAVAKLVRKEFPEALIGPRKTFVGLSRKVQFAAIIPAKGGKAELGLPVPVRESKRLEPMKKRPWAERHIALLTLSSPTEVDAEVKRLLKLAWEKG